MFGFKKTGLSSTAIAAMAISAGLGVGATPAMAQTDTTTPATSTGGLDEIVVTARKRAENIDIVPLAITALTSARIEERNIKSLEDVSAFSPGFFTQSQTGTGFGRNDRSFRQLTFRGVGANNTNIGTGAGGTAFLDGAPVLNSSLSNVQDIERVEVLRGPQSAYFGRSTFIGAINYITKDPTNEFTGRITGEIGTDDLQETSLSFSGPITDWASFRISGRRAQQGGQYKTRNESVTLGDRQTDSISATLLLEPTDSLTIKAFYNHFEDHDGPGAQYIIGGKTLGPGGSNCSLGGSNGAYFCGTVPQKANAALITANLQLTPTLINVIRNTNNFNLPFNYNDYIQDFGLTRKADQFSNRIDYDFGGNGPTFTSMTAYHQERIVTVADFINRQVTAGNTTTSEVGYEDYDWSQELRLVSNQDSRFRWLLGANYIELEQSTSGIVSVFGPFGISNTGGAGNRIGFNHVETPAVFAGLYYDIVPRLTLTVEGRYQEDEISTRVWATNAPGPRFVNATATYENFSPRVSLDYKLTDNSTVYGLFSRGYKPGGFNATSVLSQPAFIVNQLSSLGGGASFGEEQLDNYEAGIRGNFLDNRLRLAANAYYGDYTGVQVPAFAPAFTTETAPGSGIPNNMGPFMSFGITRNAGDVELKGFEFEAEAIVADGLRLGATFAYNSTEMQKWFCAECSSILAQNSTGTIQSTAPRGKSLPGAPEITATLSANYEREFGTGYTGFIGGDFLYRGSYFADAANLAESGDSGVINVRTGFRKDNFSVEVYAKNLFDDQSPNVAYNPFDLFSSSSSFFASGGNALVLALPDRQRLGVRASVNF